MTLGANLVLFRPYRDLAMLVLFLFLGWCFKPYYDAAPQLHDLTLFYCWDTLHGN